MSAEPWAGAWAFGTCDDSALVLDIEFGHEIDPAERPRLDFRRRWARCRSLVTICRHAAIISEPEQSSVGASAESRVCGRPSAPRVIRPGGTAIANPAEALFLRRGDQDEEHGCQTE